jgi:predicted O-linked N-acetylglucosamine transferase (SPINDLY family)
LLGDMPTARLMLHAPAGPRHSIVTERIARAGLPLNQVICIPRKSWREYINLYHQIDIALDPFPFGGGITTCDALWMGVPVVTLRGNTAVGRGGMSILSNLGMPELIALGKPAYLRIARELAGDFIHLAHLRRTLRDRLAASSLMDANYFARDLESLYRRAWHGWIREPAR